MRVANKLDLHILVTFIYDQIRIRSALLPTDRLRDFLVCLQVRNLPRLSLLNN